MYKIYNISDFLCSIDCQLAYTYIWPDSINTQVFINKCAAITIRDSL